MGTGYGLRAGISNSGPRRLYQEPANVSSPVSSARRSMNIAEFRLEDGPPSSGGRASR